MSLEKSNIEKHGAIPDDLQRYAKQIRFPEFGIAGQKALLNARVVIVGVGALGSVSANTLVRAGVGRVDLVDRDFIEKDNLQRQVLYRESDIGMPKAVVAAQSLRQINSEIKIEAHVADLDYKNVLQLFKSPRPADVIVDGTDNFETRFLINDAAVSLGIPWVYGGCLGCEGQTMTILSGETACLGCLMMNGPPPPGTTATCDSAGILSPIINVIASIQAIEAIKIMSGNRAAISRQLQTFDLWGNRAHAMNIESLRDQVDCVTCKNERFDWLAGDKGSNTAILCGRNAVQLSFPDRSQISLEHLATRLESNGPVEQNKFLLRFQADSCTVTVFTDGRAIINGTEDIAFAKKIYSQYIGA